VRVVASRRPMAHAVRVQATNLAVARWRRMTALRHCADAASTGDFTANPTGSNGEVGGARRFQQYLEGVRSASAERYDRVVERRRAVALALHFREAEGLSIAQIAARLGRSPATIKAYF
jgi:DNA-directed RNA polymerase specialized sigma24 family protein